MKAVPAFGRRRRAGPHRFGDLLRRRLSALHHRPPRPHRGGRRRPERHPRPDRADLPRPRRLLRHRRLCRLDPHRDLRLELLAPPFSWRGPPPARPGVLLAIPALRVTGPYLAMVTIAFGFVVEQGAAEWKEVTGGWNGIMNIPTPGAFGYSFDERAYRPVRGRLHHRGHRPVRQTEGEPVGARHAGGARFRDRRPIPGARPDPDPHHRLRAVGGPGRSGGARCSRP